MSLVSNEKEIIREVLAGNKNKFQLLMDAYQRPIYFYLLKILKGHIEDCEDATAETFAKAYLKLAHYNNKLKFSSWLYRIAHNIAVDLIRKKSKYFLLELDETIIEIKEIKNLEIEYNLSKILSLLNPFDRSLLTLSYLEGLEHEEISQILKIPKKQIPLKLHRSKEKAKKIVHKYIYAYRR